MPHCVVIPSLLNHLNGPKDAKININLTKLQPASVVWIIVIPVSVCKHDFCKKALSDFSETCGVYCYFGLVMWIVEFPLASGSYKI